MPSGTRLARDVAAKITAVSARPRQGWQWLIASRDPISWAALRAKLALTTLPLPRTNGGRLVVAGAVGVLLLLALLWYASGQRDDKGVITYPHASLVNPILASLGALFLIYAAIRQARTASAQAEIARKQAQIAADRHAAQTKADQQRRITDTFSKAVELLGSDKMEMRVGGIYTLERLAREALASQQGGDATTGEASDLYWTVMETLTAFVRERSRWRASKPARVGMADKSDYLWPLDVRSVTQPNETEPPRPEPATDIAVVIAVIGRRPQAGREREQRRQWRFDLRTTDLRGAALAGAHLEDADLFRAYLEGTDLSYAHLEGASFRQAHLEDAYLFRAHLEGADLSGTEGLTQAQIDETWGDAETKLPEGLTRPARWTQPERGVEPAPFGL